MQIHYHKAPGGNFGDDLNEWIWDSLIPDLDERGSVDDVLVGLGSILHGNRLKPYKAGIAVMGSGYNGGALIDAGTRRRCRFYAVRGPLTKDSLALDETVAMLDPGALAPDLQAPAKDGHGRALFIPHRANLFEQDGGLVLSDIAEAAGLELLSPALDSRHVLERISGASLVVSESLHGAIVADAYRVPWVAVKLGPGFTPFKWKDWGMSLDIDVEFFDLLPGLNLFSNLGRKTSWRLGMKAWRLDWRAYSDLLRRVIAPRLTNRLQAAKSLEPCLSRRSVLDARKGWFYDALDSFRKDFGP